MIYCELKGGLGNQLFQVFATIACAMRENRSFLFLRKEKTGKRSTYWNSLFSRLFIHTIDSCIHAEEIYKEPFFSYHPMVIMGNHGHGSLKTTHIDGYFQSPRYFEDKFDIICSFLKIDEFKKQFALNNGYFYLDIPYWTDNDNEDWKRLIDNKIFDIVTFGLNKCDNNL